MEGLFEKGHSKSHIQFKIISKDYQVYSCSYNIGLLTALAMLAQLLEPSSQAWLHNSDSNCCEKSLKTEILPQTCDTFFLEKVVMTPQRPALVLIETCIKCSEFKKLLHLNRTAIKKIRNENLYNVTENEKDLR